MRTLDPPQPREGPAVRIPLLQHRVCYEPDLLAFGAPALYFQLVRKAGLRGHSEAHQVDLVEAPMIRTIPEAR